MVGDRRPPRDTGRFAKAPNTYSAETSLAWKSQLKMASDFLMAFVKDYNPVRDFIHVHFLAKHNRFRPPGVPGNEPRSGLLAKFLARVEPELVKVPALRLGTGRNKTGDAASARASTSASPGGGPRLDSVHVDLHV